MISTQILACDKKVSSRLLHHKQFFDQAGNQLGIHDPSLWYKVKVNQIASMRKGKSILKHYHNSLSDALRSVYPSVAWQPWRFTLARSGKFWNNRENQRQFLDYVANQMKFTGMEDWYTVNSSDIVKYGGTALLNKYKAESKRTCSFSRAIMSAYPEYAWQPWRFKGFMQTNDCEKEFLEWFAQEAEMKSMEDWYNVTARDIEKSGFGTFLRKNYDGCLYKALDEVYPEYSWQPWRFARVPNEFWENVNNHEKFFESLATRLQINNPYGWYKVERKDIETHGGATLLLLYDNSPKQALQELYPEISVELSYYHLPRRFWTDKEEHRPYMDWLSKVFHIEKPEDWYGISKESVEDHGGLFFLQYYSNSLSKALRAVYLEVPWQPWRFGTGKDYDAHKGVLTQLESKLFVDTPSDWKYVSEQHMASIEGGRTLLMDYGGSLFDILRAHYPTLASELHTLKERISYKTQQFLGKIVTYFLGTKSAVEYDFWMGMAKYRDTNHAMQFDIWVPSLNLAVEYQGMQHYVEDNFMSGDKGVFYQHAKDEQKAVSCSNLGINLIRVPFWMNHAIHQCLRTNATSNYHTNNLNVGSSSRGIFNLSNIDTRGVPPISKVYPFPVQTPSQTRAGSFEFNGQLAFEPSSGHNWNASVEGTGWFSCVRHKGVRILADGKGNFFTFEGNRVYPPQWVVEQFNNTLPVEFELVWDPPKKQRKSPKKTVADKEEEEEKEEVEDEPMEEEEKEE